MSIADIIWIISLITSITGLFTHNNGIAMIGVVVMFFCAGIMHGKKYKKWTASIKLLEE
ncbi:MAG: hypothetical protein AMQ22_00005 [Candidatus Methanofastidiosum methylothiophilum]|uniref:Uncharacterized protein n=1 Tax=Candidatus Methanofastidiosum methylothiophilum TaxID=1705564 RepID=A0A150J9D1_9EURY|nr:MAG: hypothetical protein AMQ22_00005 [Candidatus Methanofastidiosum methylthiophilus]